MEVDNHLIIITCPNCSDEFGINKNEYGKYFECVRCREMIEIEYNITSIEVFCNLCDASNWVEPDTREIHCSQCNQPFVYTEKKQMGRMKEIYMEAQEEIKSIQSYYERQLEQIATSIIEGIVGKPIDIAKEQEKLDKLKQERALDIVKGVLEARRNSYTHPLKNFTNIAKGWSVIFGVEVTPDKVALAMQWLKTVRSSTDPFLQDNDIDGMGYWDCHDEIIRAFKEAGFAKVPSIEEIDALIKTLNI